MNATNTSNGNLVTVLSSVFVPLMNKAVRGEDYHLVTNWINALGKRVSEGWNTQNDALNTATMMVSRLLVSEIDAISASYIQGACFQLINWMKAYNTPEATNLIVVAELLRATAELDSEYPNTQYAIHQWVVTGYDRMGYMKF